MLLVCFFFSFCLLLVIRMTLFSILMYVGVLAFIVISAFVVFNVILLVAIFMIVVIVIPSSYCSSYS